MTGGRNASKHPQGRNDDGIDKTVPGKNQIALKAMYQVRAMSNGYIGPSAVNERAEMTKAIISTYDAIDEEDNECECKASRVDASRYVI